jgi:hypothetical protein
LAQAQPGCARQWISEQQLEARRHQPGGASIGMVKLKGAAYAARANNGKSVAMEVDARTRKILSADPAPRLTETSNHGCRTRAVANHRATGTDALTVTSGGLGVPI